MSKLSKTTKPLNSTAQNTQHRCAPAQAARPTAVMSSALKSGSSSHPKTSASEASKESVSIQVKPKAPPKSNKATVSFASMAEAQERKRACASVAQASKEPPQEADLPDPCDIHPPPICDDQVVSNPNAVPATHETEVVSDSGASDHMVPSFRCLCLIWTAFCDVTIADGTLHESNFQGLLRTKVRCCRTGKQHAAPNLDALLLPGLRKALWSVSGFVCTRT